MAEVKRGALSEEPRNVLRRIARLEARLRAHGLSRRALRKLEPLKLEYREWGLRAALMLLEC